jgi:hypothetical protein
MSAAISAVAMSSCVSQTSPCVPRNASPALPEATLTRHSSNSYAALMARQIETMMK